MLFLSRSHDSVIGPLFVVPILYFMFTNARLVATSKDTFTVFEPSHWIGAVTKAPLFSLFRPAGTCNWMRFFLSLSSPFLSLLISAR